MPPAYREINGLRLRYEVRGASAPLAIVGHGLLGSMEQLDSSLPGLEGLLGQVRILRYDARGHGESEGPTAPEDYTWDALGRDMLAFADAERVDRAVFAGGSMGAGSAMWVAIERPERVRAMIAAMPPPLGHEHMRDRSEQGALAMLQGLARAVEQHGIERTVQMLKAFPQFAPTPEEGEERARWLLAQDPSTLVPAIRGLGQAPYHDPELYRRITAPTLVIGHEGDPLHPVRAARLLADRVPGARLIVGDYPGYWREHPEELVSELRTFLATIG
ncbi:MAG: alpha/beta fold hydrolase [Dehalococcoidia bacterium]|nr:alpha/beta fold hydrolase [Dehalococcoidia bacterium]